MAHSFVMVFGVLQVSMHPEDKLMIINEVIQLMYYKSPVDDAFSDWDNCKALVVINIF